MSGRKIIFTKILAVLGGGVGSLALAVGALQAAELTPEQQLQLDRGKARVMAGQGAAAWPLLEPLEELLAGHADYDLMLGQAALAAGRHTRAAFAFERCLAVNPLHGACRLGMARAHMMLNETSGARNELDLIARSAPPPEIRKILNEYLADLTNRQAPGQDTRLRAYGQIGIGYDSNFNHATTADALALPLFNNTVFTLSREGRARDSFYNQLKAGLSYSKPIAPSWRFLADATVSSSLYWETHDYNTLVADIGLGAAYRKDNHQFTIKGMAQNYRLGSHSYRNLVGVLGQYAYTVSPTSELTAFTHVNRMNYPQESVRNAYRYTAGLSWSQLVAGGKAVVYASAYGGKEEAIKSRAADALDYRFGGLRIGGMAMLGPRTRLEVSAGAERRRHDGNEILFLTRRKETVYDTNLGLNYALNRKWSLRPHWRYTRSKSNIPLRDYQRHAVTVSLRYEFF